MRRKGETRSKEKETLSWRAYKAGHVRDEEGLDWGILSELEMGRWSHMLGVVSRSINKA